MPIAGKFCACASSVDTHKQKHHPAHHPPWPRPQYQRKVGSKICGGCLRHQLWTHHDVRGRYWRRSNKWFVSCPMTIALSWPWYGIWVWPYWIEVASVCVGWSDSCSRLSNCLRWKLTARQMQLLGSSREAADHTSAAAGEESFPKPTRPTKLDKSERVTLWWNKSDCHWFSFRESNWGNL